VKTSHGGLMLSVNSRYEMPSDIKSLKRALGQVKLDSENEPKAVKLDSENEPKAILT
jgi:hypothetical protein